MKRRDFFGVTVAALLAPKLLANKPRPEVVNPEGPLMLGSKFDPSITSQADSTFNQPCSWTFNDSPCTHVKVDAWVQYVNGVAYPITNNAGSGSPPQARDFLRTAPPQGNS